MAPASSPKTARSPAAGINVTENAHGTKGSVELVNDRTNFTITDRKGNVTWSYPKETPIIDPYQREHDDLFGAISFNNDYNEAERGARSTMTALMGRMAGYSGELMTLEAALASDVRMSVLPTSLQDEPPIKPDATGAYPLPVPGKYKAI